MRTITYISLAIVVAAAVAAQAAPPPKPAPAIELQQLSGQTFRLADHRGKSAVLVWFWAPW